MPGYNMTKLPWLVIVSFAWICTLSRSDGLKLWLPTKVTDIATGTALHLRCIPVGLGPDEKLPQMNWVSPDGRYLKSSPDGRVSVISRPEQLSLTIRKMKLADAGNYTCVAFEDSRTTKLVVPVKVFQSPEIMILPRENLEIAYGSNLVLKCMALGLGPDGNPPKLTWITPAGYSVNNTFGRLFINRGHYTLTLYIRNIQAPDVGRYTCRATGQKRALLTEAFVLVSLYRPITYTNCPTIQHLVAHESGLIHCLADASPALHVSWKFKGAFIDDDDHYRQERKGLRISNVTHYDAGLYSCIAVVEQIGSFKRKDITIHVHNKPYTE